MAEAAEIVDSEAGTKPKRGAKGLLIGLGAALVLGGGGFYAVFAGILDPAVLAPKDKPGPSALSDIAFVAMDPIMISLPPGSSAKHLRFAGQLEVEAGHEGEVTALMPRIVDVLNTYLRAVEVRDLEQPSAIARLRAQMLRRVQVVTGEGRVRDLLIGEFILN